MEIGGLEFVEKNGLLTTVASKPIPSPEWMDEFRNQIFAATKGAPILTPMTNHDGWKQVHEEHVIKPTEQGRDDWHFDGGNHDGKRRDLIALANLSSTNKRGQTNWISGENAYKALKEALFAHNVHGPYLKEWPEPDFTRKKGVFDRDNNPFTSAICNLLNEDSTSGRDPRLTLENGLTSVNWARHPHHVFIMNNVTGIHMGEFKAHLEEEPENRLYRHTFPVID